MTVEDGTLVAGADSYTSLAFADAYMASHASATAWLALNSAAREGLLVRASRQLDALVEWKGYKLDIDQGLGWPRQAVPYDQPVVPGLFAGSNTYPENKVPREVQQATVELAALNMAGDRGGDVEGAGIKSVGLGDGALEIEFDSTTAVHPLGQLVPSMLTDFVETIAGRASGRRGTIKTVRQ